MNAFFELFKDFGYPVLICGILFWYVYHINESNNKKIEALEKTITKNTATMTAFEKALTEALSKFETVIFDVFKKKVGENDD